VKFDSALPPGKFRPTALRAEAFFIPRPDIFHAASSSSLVIPEPGESQDDGLTIELTSVGFPPKDGDDVKAIGVSQGDIVWTNGRFSARRLKVDNVNHWAIHQSLLLAKVINMTLPPEPLGHNLITKPAPKWMQFALTGNAEVQPDGFGLIKIHDDLDGEEGVATDNDARDPSRATYEEVVSVGKYVPAMQDIRPGDLVAVNKQRTATNITIRGQRYTLTAMSNISGVIMRAADRPEWTR
jgi:hypothetical protein